MVPVPGSDLRGRLLERGPGGVQGDVDGTQMGQACGPTSRLAAAGIGAAVPAERLRPAGAGNSVPRPQPTPQ